MRSPKPRSISSKSKTAQAGNPKPKVTKRPKPAAKKTSPSRTASAQVWKELSRTVALATAQSRVRTTRSFEGAPTTLTRSTSIDAVYLTPQSKLRFAATLQRTYQVPLDQDDLKRAKTFGDLVNIIVSKLPKPQKGFDRVTRR